MVHTTIYHNINFYSSFGALHLQITPDISFELYSSSFWFAVVYKECTELDICCLKHLEQDLQMISIWIRKNLVHKPLFAKTKSISLNRKTILRLIIAPVSSHSPLSRTQLICVWIKRSSFNICLETNFVASHFARLTASLTLPKIPFCGLPLVGLGRIGLGRGRLGGGCCLGFNGRLAAGSGGVGAPWEATFATCLGSCLDSILGGRCCLPNNSII